MENIIIRNNISEIIATGSVIMDKSEDIIIEFPIESEESLIYTFKHATDENNPRFDLNKTKDRSLDIIFYNFHKGANIGNVDAINIGYYKSKELYLKFRLKPATGGQEPKQDFIMTYTFYHKNN